MPAATFVPPPGGQLAPSGARARVEANLEALRIVGAPQREQRLANADEQRMLAAWSDRGAVPQLFDEQRREWAYDRDTLHEMLSAEANDPGRRTTINAHYTDPGIAAAMWQAVRAARLHRGAGARARLRGRDLPRHRPRGRAADGRRAGPHDRVDRGTQPATRRTASAPRR